MGSLWTILIGFLAGLLARWLISGDREPSGFILTALLGVAGAFVATFLGQSIGWYRAGDGAGLIGATLGAVLVLWLWHKFGPRRGTLS